MIGYNITDQLLFHSENATTTARKYFFYRQLKVASEI